MFKFFIDHNTIPYAFCLLMFFAFKFCELFVHHHFINSSCIVLKHGMTGLGEGMILHLFEASTNLFHRFGHHSLMLSLSLNKNIRIFYFILKLTSKL